METAVERVVVLEEAMVEGKAVVMAAGAAREVVGTVVEKAEVVTAAEEGVGVMEVERVVATGVEMVAALEVAMVAVKAEERGRRRRRRGRRRRRRGGGRRRRGEARAEKGRQGGVMVAEKVVVRGGAGEGGYWRVRQPAAARSGT